jgi:hypothetical protein
MNVNRSLIQQTVSRYSPKFRQFRLCRHRPRKGSSPEWAETPARRLGERQRVEPGPRERIRPPSALVRLSRHLIKFSRIQSLLLVAGHGQLQHGRRQQVR